MIYVKKGRVLEVFIPDKIIEKVYTKEIGFKVLVDNETIIIIEKISEENSNIYKDDYVLITDEGLKRIDE